MSVVKTKFAFIPTRPEFLYRANEIGDNIQECNNLVEITYDLNYKDSLYSRVKNISEEYNIIVIGYQETISDTFCIRFMHDRSNPKAILASDFVEWLKNDECKKPNLLLDKRMRVDKSFYTACKNGDLKLAKQIFKLNPNILISTPFYEPVFWIVCKMGYLNIAKWLLKIKPDINIADHTPFIDACVHGHLSVAQWLLKISPNTKISVSDEVIFRAVCSKGKLDVAKWLLKIKPDINISVCNDWVFYNSPRNIKQWLCEVNAKYKKTLEGGRILSLRSLR